MSHALHARIALNSRQISRSQMYYNSYGAFITCQYSFIFSSAHVFILSDELAVNPSYWLFNLLSPNILLAFDGPLVMYSYPNYYKQIP